MTTAKIAPGLELANPVTVTRTVFTATPATTNGAYVEVEATYPPQSNKPPVHHHPLQTEYFTVLTGAMTVVRAGYGIFFDALGVVNVNVNQTGFSQTTDQHILARPSGQVIIPGSANEHSRRSRTVGAQCVVPISTEEDRRPRDVYRRRAELLLR